MKNNLLFIFFAIISLFISSCADLSTKSTKSTNQSVELQKNEVGVPGDHPNPENHNSTNNPNLNLKDDDQLNSTSSQDPYDHTRVNARNITQINPKTFVMNFADQNEKALILVGMLKYWESRGKKSFYVMVSGESPDDSSKFLVQLLKVYQKKGSANLVEWVIFQKLKNFFPRKEGETPAEMSHHFDEYATKLEDDFNLNMEPDPVFGNCEKLLEIIGKDRKAVCFSSKPKSTLNSANVINYQIKLPPKYLTQFTLADYLSYGQKIAKELLGKLK